MSLQEIAEQNGFQEFYRTKIDKSTIAYYLQKSDSNEYLEIDVSKSDGQTEWVYYIEQDGEAMEVVGHGHQSYDLERILTKGWRADPVAISEVARLYEHVRELEQFIQETELLLGDVKMGHCSICDKKKTKRPSILDSNNICYKC